MIGDGWKHEVFSDNESPKNDYLRNNCEFEWVSCSNDSKLDNNGRPGNCKVQSGYEPKLVKTKSCCTITITLSECCILISKKKYNTIF